MFMHLQHFLCMACLVCMFNIFWGLCIYNIFTCIDYKFDAYLCTVIKSFMPNVFMFTKFDIYSCINGNLMCIDDYV